MRYGLNSFLLVSPFTNDSCSLFSQIRKWKFDTIEIPIEDPDHIDPSYVKEELDRANLACGSICACMGPDRDLRGTREQQKTGSQYLKRLLEQAAEMDCPRIIGPVYSAVGRADAHTDKEKERHWNAVVRNLKQVCDHAEKLGREICLEPLNRFETDMINTCDQGLKMIKDVDSKALKLHLDTFHMNIEEKDPAKAIRKAGKRLGHFHACGSDRGTPGNDHIDWEPIVAALKDIKYDGDIVIESFTTDVKVIARAAAIWRPMEKTRNEIATKGIAFLKKAFSA